MSDTNDNLTVHVELGARSYEIRIVSKQLHAIAESVDRWVPATARTALIVTDQNVTSPHAQAVDTSLTDALWRTELVVLEPGEQTKSLSFASRLYDELVAMRAGRDAIVIAVGGGVIGDLAGFVAATYARGIAFVQVPTTLLAQVDSSVGGKVGINHPQGKNLIGAFHQPLGVFIDTALLNTLPDREYRSGLAEVIKYGVILDAEFFEFLEQNIAGLNDRDPAVLRHVIATCCRLKAQVVEQDEFERTGARAVLNYGHTFAHPYEALSGYGKLLHGEAVAIGMVSASKLAEARNLIEASITQRQVDLLQSVQLPTALPPEISLSPDAILESMKLDKKATAGKLRFVLPTRLGGVELVDDVAESDVRAALTPR